MRAAVILILSRKKPVCVQTVGVAFVWGVIVVNIAAPVKAAKRELRIIIRFMSSPPENWVSIRRKLRRFPKDRPNLARQTSTPEGSLVQKIVGVSGEAASEQERNVLGAFGF